VTSVGADALTVPSPDVINDEERFAELARASTLSQVEKTKVVTEGGALLGTIAHLEIDDDARTVTAYVLSSSFRDRLLRHDAESVKADEVLRLGEGGIMVVPNAVAARLQAERG
jgi:sporulation protein YlmC with PRC-barrel domain